MANSFATKPPVWFWIVGVLLLLWGAVGCYACYAQFTMGADSWGDPDNLAYNGALYASLPAWFNYVYAAAVGFGLIGTVALLAGKAVARQLYIVSMIAVVIQFGYSFFATDMIAHKGLAATVPFPVFIVAVAVFEIWLAGYAARRGWLS